MPPPASLRELRDRPFELLRELERRMIAKALARTKGSPEKAAALLGISRATMYRRLAEEGPGAGGKGS